MHAGAGRRQSADKGRLLADRADRRFVEIVHLPGQQPGYAAAEEQGQIGRRIVRLRASQAIGRNIDERRRCVDPAQGVGVVLPNPQLPRLALADDQPGRRQRSRRRIASSDAFAVIEIECKWRRGVWLDAGDIRADIGEQSAAHGGGQPVAELHDAEPSQQTHLGSFRITGTASHDSRSATGQCPASKAAAGRFPRLARWSAAAARSIGRLATIVLRSAALPQHRQAPS